MTDWGAEALACLKRCVDLKDWSEATVARVAARLSPRFVPAGEVAVAMGAPSDSLLWVGAGRLALDGDPDAAEGAFEFGSGSLLGEIGLLTGEPRSTTLRAARDTVLFCLAEQDAIELLDHWDRQCLTRVALARHAGGRPQAARAQSMLVTGPHPALVTELMEPIFTAVSALQRAHRAPPGLLEGPEDLDAVYARSRALDALESAHELLVVGAPTLSEEEAARWLRTVDVLVELYTADDDLGASPPPQSRARRFGIRLHAPPFRPVPTPVVPGLRVLEARRGNPGDLARLFRAYQAPSEGLRGIRGSALLRGLSDEDFRRALSQMRTVLVPAGETLFREGEPADSLFLVNSGRLQVLRQPRGASPVVIGELRPGDAIGDVSLLCGGARTATVAALRDAELVELSREAYSALRDRHPQLERGLTQGLVAKLNRPTFHEIRTLSLVSVDPGLDLAEQAAALAAALGALGRVAQIDAAAIDRALGPGSSALEPGAPGDTAVIRFLHRLEAEHDLLLLVAGPAPDAWARRALRQSDRVLLVARSEAPPAPGPLEQALSEELAALCPPPSLLLIQPAQITVASGTLAWLEPRRLETHLHARRTVKADYERVARLVTHRGVGLALGGGCTRSVAHMGVLQALSAHEVPIDMVAGTSGGSVVSVGVGAGVAFEEFWKLAVNFNGGFPHLWRSLTFPSTAILTGQRFSDLIHFSMGQYHLEDLLIPTRCVAVDLVEAKLAVFDRGPAETGVRASTAIPLVFPPLIHQGKVLVDGGVLCNLPADVLLPWCANGRILASEVSGDPSLRGDYDYTDRVSGWGILAHRLLPFLGPLRAPGLGQVLESCLVLANSHHRRSLDSLIDLLFEPDVKGYAMTEVCTPELCDTVRAQALEHARERLAGWSWRGPRR